jgi:hypothetical protein
MTNVAEQAAPGLRVAPRAASAPRSDTVWFSSTPVSSPVAVIAAAGRRWRRPAVEIRELNRTLSCHRAG